MQPRPQGKRQREVMAKLRRQPQNSYPLPPGNTHEGITLRAAIRRLADKGLVALEGDRYRLVR